MDQINLINEPKESTFFDDIDRIIHASRIDEIQELKKLVRFIDHLIQSLIQQISGGLLSDKGAKIKILHCFSIIQHCQIGNHPTIKSQIDKLKRIYENTFKHHLDSAIIPFKPKAIVLSSADIHHYIDSIKDSQSDPIYSEQPKSLVEQVMSPGPKKEPDAKNEKKASSNKTLRDHYLSNLFFTSDKQKEIMALASKKLESYAQEKKRHRMTQFQKLQHAYQSNIATTA